MPTLRVVLLMLAAIAPSQAQEFHTWGEELKPVFGVLQNAHLSGSIGLSGRCDASRLPGFPQFSSAAAMASSPLTALRETAAGDPGMTVKRDADGKLRMSERGVPDDILNVRISHMLFENYMHHDIHSANFALRVIFSAPEVRSFAEIHKIAFPQFTGAVAVPGNLGDNWPPDAPHISGSLNNMTVLEALDRVLAAFPGEVFVYWNCPQTRQKDESSHTKARNEQQKDFTTFLGCPAAPTESIHSRTISSAGLPNPFCMPDQVLLRPPDLFPTPERTIFIYFFAMKKGYGGKMLVVGG